MPTASDPEPLIAFNRRDWAILGGLLLLTLLALWPVLNVGVDWAPGLAEHDARTQWYPWRVYAAESIRAGHLPLWNPYVLCGTPFLADFQSAVFYPPNLLYCILSVALATKIIVVLHIWLSAAFTFLLCRLIGAGRWASLAGGIAFAFCAPQLLRVPAGHWGVSCAIPWLPLILFCAEWTLRRPGHWPFLLGVLAVALQLLSGIPQYVLITAILVTLFVLLRLAFDWPGARPAAVRAGGIAAFYAVGACLAGIQLWPAMEAASQGARSLPMRPEWVQQFSLGPECLLTLLVPGVFGGTGGHVYWGRYFFWEMNAYIGIVAFVLALFGIVAGKPRRLAWGLGIAAILMLLLSLGRHTPLMGIVAAVLPFGDALRGASKFLLPFAGVMALLAALGLDVLLRHKDEEWRKLQWIPLIVAAVILLSLMFMPSLQKAVKSTGETFPPARVTTADSMVMYFVRWAVAMGLVASLLLVPRMRRMTARVAPAVIIGAMVLDAITFSWVFMGGWSAFKAKDSSWPTGAGESLRKVDSGARLWALCGPEINDAMLERVPTPEGIEPNPPQRFHILFRTAQNQPIDIAPSIYQITVPGALNDRLAAGRVLAPIRVTHTGPGQRIVAQGDKWHAVENVSPVPRAAFYPLARYARNPGDALDMTLRADPRREVVIESDAAEQPPQSAALPQPAVFLRDDPEDVTIKVNASGPGWLVLRDNFFPGWTARVDGRDADILPADFAFRAVRLDAAGEHTVSFRYRPASLQIGLASTLCAVLFCGLVLVLAWRRNRSSRAGTPAVAEPGRDVPNP